MDSIETVNNTGSKMSKHQFWTLFWCAIASAGRNNAFPIFKKFRPRHWLEENRCATVDHESTLKSLLNKGWIERRGEKTYEIWEWLPGNQDRTTGHASVETYGVTDSGLKTLRSATDHAGWDLDESMAAGEVKEKAREQENPGGNGVRTGASQ